MVGTRSLFFAAMVPSLAVALASAALAQPSYATRGETIHGTIATVQDVNHLYVSDDRGYTDNVTLRAGASVLSDGVRLEPGQRVTIQGSAAGPTFLATRIATEGRSYASAGQEAGYAVPDAAYYAAPVYYPAAYYPAYYSASFFFGFGPYYRYGYRPFYGRGGFYGGRGGFYGGRGGFYGGHGPYTVHRPGGIRTPVRVR